MGQIGPGERNGYGKTERKYGGIEQRTKTAEKNQKSDIGLCDIVRTGDMRGCWHIFWRPVCYRMDHG